MSKKIIGSFMLLIFLNAILLKSYADTENIENTNLETLAIENVLLYPPFDNNVTEYTAEVGNDINRLNILAIPEDERGIAEIQGDMDLNVGDNDIIIIVTAPNGISKKEYKIRIHRRNLDEEKEYEKEKSEQQEKLESAYNVERTSTTSNATSEVLNTTEGNGKYILTLLAISIVVITIVSVIVKK